MPITTPGKHPFSPRLKNHRAFKGKSGRLVGVADLLLTPLIDMFVILVVFLIMNFSASGELLNVSKDIELPKAKTVKEMERAPIIQISADTIAVEGYRVGDADEILRSADLTIKPLTDKLREVRRIDEMMHPGQPFKGQIILNCDRAIDFKLIRKVMVAAADAGYINFNYAVLKTNQAAGAASGG